METLALCDDKSRCSFSDTFHGMTSVDQLCGDPFGGQQVTHIVIPAIPLVLLPSVAGKLSGFPINLFLLYARKYGFRTKIEFVNTTGRYLPQNKTFSPGTLHSVQYIRYTVHIMIKYKLVHEQIHYSKVQSFLYFQVMTREADVTTGALANMLFNLVDLSPPNWHITQRLITRKPKPLPPYTNVLRPFSPRIWLILLATLELICLQFALINKIYYVMPHFRDAELTRYEPSTYLFFLYPMFKITEPDPLPWFKKWSAGKMLSITWIFMAMTTVNLYNCNLRSSLVAIQYEEPPGTINDVVLNGQSVYIPRENMGHRYFCFC